MNYFSLGTPPDSGNGSVDNYNSQSLKSSASGGDRVTVTQSTAAFGSWSFFVADGMGWSLSSQNKYSVILFADTAEIDNLRYDSQNFNGYVVENDGTFKLYRQDGTERVLLIETNLPENADNLNKNSGYSVKLTRYVTGEWNFYIDEGATEARTLRGTVNDSKWTEAEVLAVRTKISNPSTSRILYFDTLGVEEDGGELLITSVLDVAFYKKIDGSDQLICWKW